MMQSMATELRIGTTIRKRRQALGMRTQQELAERIGVDRTTVANWENDVHYPTRYIGALEEVLGISLAGEDQDPDPDAGEDVLDTVLRLEKDVRDLRARLEKDSRRDSNPPLQRRA